MPPPFALPETPLDSFAGDLFGCKLQRILQDSMLLKHLIAYFTLLFFSVLSSPEGSEFSWWLMAQSVFLYAWFVASSRMHSWLTLFVVALFLLSKVLSVAKDQVRTVQAKDRYDLLSVGTLVLALVVTVLGVADKAIQKYQQFSPKGSFSLFKFFVGTPTCEREPPDNQHNLPLAFLFNAKRIGPGASEHAEQGTARRTPPAFTPARGGYTGTTSPTPGFSPTHRFSANGGFGRGGYASVPTSGAGRGAAGALSAPAGRWQQRRYADA